MIIRKSFRCCRNYLQQRIYAKGFVADENTNNGENNYSVIARKLCDEAICTCCKPMLCGLLRYRSQ